MPNPEELASAHWDWVVTWLEMVYKDAFIHGYGHGYEAGQKDSEAEKRPAKATGFTGQAIQ